MTRSSLLQPSRGQTNAPQHAKLPRFRRIALSLEDRRWALEILRRRQLPAFTVLYTLRRLP